MKNLFKKALKLTIICALLVVAGCEKDLYTDTIKKKYDKSITLQQFKKETNIKDFQTYFRASITGSAMQNKSTELTDFVIDTVAIQKYVSQNNKTTYTFRIYSMVADVEVDQKFNLVYRKQNDEWEKAIISFKKKVNAAVGENQLEQIKKIYDSMGEQPDAPDTGVSYICANEYYYIQCDGSCRGECDGWACPTGECIQHVVIISMCGESTGGETDPNEVTPTEGGEASSFEYSPNLYDNPVYDDQNYINTIRAQQFFSHLSSVPGAQSWVNASDVNTEIYNQIIEYLTQNNWSPESQNFANQLMNDMVQNDENTNLINDENVTLVEADQSAQILNINKYLECFDRSQGAIFTIYVDQPTANSNETWSGSVSNPNVGHTFISIRQGDTRRVMGFYPSEAVSLNNNSSDGAFYDDSHHAFDVALSFSINATHLNNLVNFIAEQSNVTYNLNTNNCSDFGIGATRTAGLYLPPAYGTWGLGSIGGAGNNPGQLGQNIRNMPIPAGAVKTTTSGNALSNTGTCN